VLRFEETPIFIINRNRVSSTRKLVLWLLVAGCTDITIIDNDSTYPQLLAYYESEMPKQVKLIKAGNIGPSAPMVLGLYEALQRDYVITDSDCVPADICPLDLIAKLHEVMARFPAKNKVGPSLRIDNLPTEIPFRQKILDANKGFWQTRLDYDCWVGAIDSTFALWRWSSGWQGPDPAIGARLDMPYCVEHWPWYVWPITEEERYYAERTLPPPISHLRQFYQESGVWAE